VARAVRRIPRGGRSISSLALVEPEAYTAQRVSCNPRFPTSAMLPLKASADPAKRNSGISIASSAYTAVQAMMVRHGAIENRDLQQQQWTYGCRSGDLRGWAAGKLGSRKITLLAPLRRCNRPRPVALQTIRLYHQVPACRVLAFAVHRHARHRHLTPLEILLLPPSLLSRVRISAN